ncbi:MAG: Uma2 family endonuclease [Planctomycetes bacterium]|nr:Uma2 family endonuclease [Planctomycetota bacterium]
MSSVPKILLTPQEYLARERKAEFKSEFSRGRIFAMAGACWEHTLVKDNTARAVGNHLDDGPCRVLTSDLRVKVDAIGLYTYPDGINVCDKTKFEDKRFDTLLNPLCLMEVLSDSTEKYDRGAKFKHYGQVASLQEYVLIAQDEAHVESHVRQSNGDWLMTEFRGLQPTLALTSVSVRITLADIYRRLAVPENPKP